MNKNTIFLILAGLLILTLVVLLITPENSLIIGLEKENFASVSSLGLIALLIASGISRREVSFKKMVIYSLLWLVIALMLIFAYQFFKNEAPSNQSYEQALVFPYRG